MPESQGLLAQEQANQAKTIHQPPADEVKMVLFHKQRITQAKESRNTPMRCFDNLTFIQDFYSNIDAANSYLRPKKNDDEVRIVGGTTEKRIESILNELLAMNFQPEIQAFDMNDSEVQELGKVMEDVVKRTNQLEEDDDVRLDALWELLTQRAVFMEEVYEETDYGNGRIIGMCRKRLRSAIEVLVGDISMAHYKLQQQPFIVLYDRLSYPAAREIYGNSPNFKHVRPGQDLSEDVYGQEYTFRLGFLATNECEVIKYMSVPDNEYQIYVNGVPMLPVGTKLPFGYKKYPLSVTIPKRYQHHFFYGRPLTAALKYLQALNDEMVRNIIRKFRQAIEPPKAVLSSNHVYSRDIFTAGRVTYGVNADDFKNLVDHDGVTQGEIAVLQMVKEMQDEIAARGNTQLGVQPDEKQTATATIEQQKQAVKMLGLLIVAWSQMVRDYTKLRICNVVENLTKETGKEVDGITGDLKNAYRRFTLKEEPLENGKVGDKIIQFMDRDLSDKESEDLLDYQDAQDKVGKPIRMKTVNVKTLKMYPWMWYVNVVSKPKESDDLAKLMFQDKIAQASSIAQISGRPLNGERVIDEFQKTWRINDWFMEPQDSPMAGEGGTGGMAPVPGQSDMGAAATAGVGAPARREAMPNPGLRSTSGVSAK